MIKVIKLTTHDKRRNVVYKFHVGTSKYRIQMVRKEDPYCGTYLDLQHVGAGGRVYIFVKSFRYMDQAKMYIFNPDCP